ncbi:hypothetical protein ASF27_17640 [Methylobacterium sp. Leaf102]|uniref:hypothetical protein n=1 Tax=Methylobacterium sp. Leaf102 TaxID=1736253 RepID=UPI0006F65D52|nr:hypothetical protein [Methylobacterium sp. Leaf102]KQP32596.1 hypothetical protein ASF27_17640 [Methylobacterium sp. Leaf102]
MILHRWISVGLTLVTLVAPAAHAQPLPEASALPPEIAQAAVTLLGRGLKAPETARFDRLRMGRAGAVCGQVDTTNRMGQHVGPRGFVADLEAGFAALVPDGAELRNPASPAHYAAMQRALALFAANCAA